MQIKNIAVFCSSSNSIDPKYHKEAIELGKLIAENGFGLVHGGGIVGLMGVLSKTVHQNNGKSIGIIPKKLNIDGIASDFDTERIVTEDMAGRKAKINDISDAYIGMPGGYGTIEEITEVITLKQLQYHNKPIVLLNTHNFFDKFLEFVDHFYAEKFIKEVFRDLIFITNSPKEAINYILNYKEGKVPEKWELELRS